MNRWLFGKSHSYTHVMRPCPDRCITVHVTAYTFVFAWLVNKVDDEDLWPKVASI